MITPKDRDATANAIFKLLTMKTIVILSILLGLAFDAKAQIVTNQPARFKTKVVCYEGKTGSGSIAISPSPDSISVGTEEKHTVTTPGIESELTWKFSGRINDKDAYQFTFTRMTKAGDSEKTTTSKQCLFDGQRIVVFADDLHTVVMESPSAGDLKKR